MTSGNSSVGRASPCQGESRGFDPRFPLMIILLDIDDTLINSREKVHPRAFLLFKNHNVTLYSASSDIKKWADKFNVAYISKHDSIKPKADILIDDDPYFKNMVDAAVYFNSIDSFLDSWEAI